MYHWPAPLDDASVSTWLERNIEHYHQYGFSRFCCQLRSTQEVVGDVGVVNLVVKQQPACDLGYIIHANHWHQGYGYEAARAVVDWLSANRKGVGVDKIVATMATDNLGSAAVARKLGMQLKETYHNPKNLDKETFYFELDLCQDF